MVMPEWWLTVEWRNETDWKVTEEEPFIGHWCLIIMHSSGDDNICGSASGGLSWNVEQGVYMEISEWMLFFVSIFDNGNLEHCTIT